MRPAVIAACLGLFMSAPARGQDERVEWLDHHAVRLASIDPAHDDFSDLEPLKALIGEARVVSLGEQSHGDGAVFLAKCRLVEFLHEEMGFDLLVWESPMWETREMDRSLRDHSIPLDEAIAYGTWQIWTYSGHVRPVFEYARATHDTDRPLEMGGFDSQGGSNDWAKAVLAMFDPLKDGASGPIPSSIRESLTDDISALWSFDRPASDIDDLRRNVMVLGQLMDERRDDLVGAHGEREFVFMRRTVDNVAMFAETTAAYRRSGGGEIEPRLGNLRDQRMGENKIWFATDYAKDRKMILWEATMHAVHDVQAISVPGAPDWYATAVTAGGVAHDSIGDVMYTVGFTAIDGSAGSVFQSQPSVLEAPHPGSLESLLAHLDEPYVWVDFKSLPAGHWLREPIISRPLGYLNAEAVWPDQVDAMVLIRTMFPSRGDGAIPEGYLLTVQQR